MITRSIEGKPQNNSRKPVIMQVVKAQKCMKQNAFFFFACFPGFLNTIFNGLQQSKNSTTEIREQVFPAFH